MSLEEVFTDETYTEQWLANAYSYLTNSEFADISITGSNPFNFSDDIYNPIYKSFKEVTYGEEQWPYTWKYSYQGIRQAAIFIQNVDMCNELTSEERAVTIKQRYIKSECNTNKMRILIRRNACFPEAYSVSLQELKQ